MTKFNLPINTHGDGFIPVESALLSRLGWSAGIPLTLRVGSIDEDMLIVEPVRPDPAAKSAAETTPDPAPAG